MEKKYNHSPENNEQSKLNEPITAYERKQPQLFPCQYSIEKLRNKFDRAVKQAEAGEVLSHEEVKNRYKK
ncbi:MAG: hypothetical protein LUG98_01905 [Tannerellaceae bacterium]|nr:hypothetical protein [Tannerellaceae bacterium]